MAESQEVKGEPEGRNEDSDDSEDNMEDYFGEYELDETVNHIDPRFLTFFQDLIPQFEPVDETQRAVSSNISTLVEKALNTLDGGDKETAKRLALQAMIGAQIVMDDFVDGRRRGIGGQQLANWFKDCSYVLNQVSAVIPALRCFYTAAIFTWEWQEGCHVDEASLLWNNLFGQDETFLLLLRERIYELIDKILSLAKLAMKRSLYNVGSVMCTEIAKAMHTLVYTKRINRYDTTAFSVNKQFYDTLKPICICQARCLFHMGFYDEVKKACSAVLDKMCDYDDSEALELWGMALYYEGQLGIAEKKIKLALEYANKGGDDESRLMEVLEEISMESIWMNDEEEEVGECSGGVDPSWLVGTAVDESKRGQSSTNSKSVREKKTNRKTFGKKTKKKTYGRYSAQTKNSSCKKETLRESLAQKRNTGLRNRTSGLLMEDGQERSRCSSECSVGTTSTMISDRGSQYSGQWTDSDSEEETTLSEYCLPTGPIDPPTGDSEEEIEECSFYEQSRRAYLFGETSDRSNQMTDTMLLNSGIDLNMGYMARFEEKPAATNRREPFYEPFKSREVLGDFILKQPEVFLRCKVYIEGSHLSYCKPVNSVSNIDCIVISGRQKAGQIYNEDEVVVQLLDSEHDKEDKRHGKIVGVWERKRYKDVKHPVFICTLDDMESHLVRPMCKTIPKINILNDAIMRKCPQLRKYKVEVYNYDHNCGTLSDPKICSINPSELNRYVFLVVLIKWRHDMVYPKGAVIRILPYGKTLSQGLVLLNLKYEVPSLYQKSVVDQTESMLRQGFNEPNMGYDEGRLDLTSLTIFTIDPPGSLDLDDALSVERLNSGFKVGVHIADVSQYVEEGDPIDQEARKRATTFYPGIKGASPRYMIPEPLSTDMCSLLPNKTRLTLSVFFYLTKDGRLQQTDSPSIEIKKTTVRSCQKFTYREVQDIIDERSGHRLQGDIKCLYQLAAEIRKRRLGNSMFAMNMTDEISPEENAETDTVEAHYLVEEFMIMANQAVARRLVRTYPDSVPLRCQPAPDKDKITKFVKTHSPYIDVLTKLQDKKISAFKKPKVENIIGTSGKHQNASIMVQKHIWDRISSATPTEASKMIRTDNLFPIQHLVLQSWYDIQERAEYRCSSCGLTISQGLQHYSLDMLPYTHFTSPIRRYIDLVVHRILHTALKKKPSPYNKEDIEKICTHVNSVSKHSKDYEQECKTLKQAVDLKKNPKIVTCYVNEVTDRNLALESPDMKHVSSIHRELPLNLLDIGFKPEFGQDPTTGQVFVTVTWRKRIYDSKGARSIVPFSKSQDERKALNPNAEIYFVKLQQWARLLNCCFEGRNKDLSKKIRNTNYTTSEHGFDDVSTENLDPTKMQSNTIFSMKYKHGQSVQVLMAAVPWKGMLVPKPVVYNITNNVKFCLQHLNDPVLHLSRYATTTTCDQYKDTKMYQNRWLPLMEMESAINAVINEESCIINSVPIKFGKNLEGSMKFPESFCEDRNIELTGTVSEDSEDDKQNEAHDWLCIKYVSPVAQSNKGFNSSKQSTQQTLWVAHAEITSVVKKKTTKDESKFKIIVTFSLHTNSPPLPAEARTKNSMFSVEILMKSEVDRRTEKYIRQLPDEEDSLARTIALNKNAIPKLSESRIEMAKSLRRDLVIPPSDDQRPLPNNNIKQQEAIDKALHNRFTLIQGPSGTGKTFTGVKLLCLFDQINNMLAREGGQRRQVMMCGPSNKSVDLIAKMMIHRLGSLCPNFVRVYGRSLEEIDYPVPGKLFRSKRSTRDNKADPCLASVTLHHLIRQKGKPNAEEIKRIDKKFIDSKFAPQPRDILETYSRVVRKASIDEIRKHNVILCTTAVGSNPKMMKATKGLVYQVIVDEAGMCPEPQCLVPIIATRAEQVVLIGDHKQLRPIIQSKEAAELGLDKSLFERYAYSNAARNVQFTMLVRQYRMNPELCRFPSDQFYNGRLTTGFGLWGKNTIDIWPKCNGQSYPHVFVPVIGEEIALSVSTEDGNENSKSNLAEIEYVVKVYQYFIKKGIKPWEINVISQYNAQCTEIKNRLQSEGFKDFNVTTVVSSQGGEWDYVIFSTVRSLPDYKIEKTPTEGWCKQNLGFITDENQINVALTRARKGLVIVGNVNLLRCNKVFSKLIQQYQDTGCVLGPEVFPPPYKHKR